MFGLKNLFYEDYTPNKRYVLKTCVFITKLKTAVEQKEQ